MLAEYLDQYELLRSSKPLREGFPCSIQLKWDEGGPLRVATELPDDDTLSILLHRLRPFILSREPASYVKVNSTIGRRVKSTAMRKLIRRQLRVFEGEEFQKSMQISLNEVILNSERTLNNWLNSHEYHRDPERRPAVSDLMAAAPGDLARGVMVNMLVEKTRAISNTAGLVALLFNRSERISFTTSEADMGAST